MIRQSLRGVRIADEHLHPGVVLKSIASDAGPGRIREGGTSDMPTRRALLQSLAGIPFAPLLTINGLTKSAMTAIPPGKYLMFADPWAMDFERFEKPCPFTQPTGFEMEVIPVELGAGQSIDDVVQIYRLDEK